MTDLPRHSLADVRATYSAERRRNEWLSDWASALIYRPISILVTPPLLRLRISATQVTLLTLAVALMLPVLAAIVGLAAAGTIGALGFFCMVLDCVDGNIARATQTSSDKGAYLDFLTDIAMRLSLYLALGILAESDTQSQGLLAGHGTAVAITAGGLYLLARLCRLEMGPTIAANEIAAAASDSASGVIGRFIFPIFSGAERLLPIFTLVAAFAGGLDWILLWILAIGAGDFIYTQVDILRRLRKR